jgi:hypothetical protein
MKKLVTHGCVIILGCISLLVAPVAHATSPAPSLLGSLKVNVLKKPTCDRRAPRVEVVLTEPATEIRFGYPESGADYVLKRGPLQPGRHKVAFPRQPFGSTRQWVVVAGTVGAVDKPTSKTLTFKRPRAGNCVRTQLHELQHFRRGINKACPQGTVKDYVVRVWVRRGSPGYITWPGEVSLFLQNGRWLTAPGQVLGKRAREAEFHRAAGPR